MRSKRKENRDKGNEEFGPSNEESQHLQPEQPLVEEQNEELVLEQNKDLEIHHGHIPARDLSAFVPDPMAEESRAKKLQDASKVMSDAIFACMKAFIENQNISSKIDQKNSEKEVNQRSNHSKDHDQGSGSSRAGDPHRPTTVLPNQEERYMPPHRRQAVAGQRSQSCMRGNINGNGKQPMNYVHDVTNPQHQPEAYEDMTHNGFSGINAGTNTRGAQYPFHLLSMRSPAMVDPEMVRDMVQKLYGPGLRQIGRPEFHKPYPELIDMNNPYPNGYKVPDFKLFSGEDGLSSVEHVARFTIQCGALANLESFAQLKLRLFPNSLTGMAFAWYASLPRNSVLSWPEMERLFHTQFYRAEPEVCITDLSRISQRNGESTGLFIDRFKKMGNKCKVFLPEIEFVKMAQKGLDFGLRKKFQGMEFRDFFELAVKVGEYEELLKEESNKRKTIVGSYFQEMEKIVLAEIRSTGSCVCPLIKKKLDESWKKNVQSTLEMQYTFDVSKTEDIFDYLVKEKFITFPQDHRVLSKEELKGREYCKYHNSFNHAIKNCWAFKNILQDRLNKVVIKFPEKKEAMSIDEDPFLPAASVNVNVTDLRALWNEKKGGKQHVQERNISRCWVPKGKIFEVRDDMRKKNVNKIRVFPESQSRAMGESTAFGPKNQHFSRRVMTEYQGSVVKPLYQNTRSQWYPEESSHYRPRSTNVYKEYAGSLPTKQNGNVQRTLRMTIFVLPPKNDMDDQWQVARHKKFPQPLTKTQKRRLLRQREATRNSKEESKTKFGGATTVDKQGDLSSEEQVNVERTITLKIGQIVISVDCDTRSFSSVLKTPVIVPQGSVIESNNG